MRKTVVTLVLAIICGGQIVWADETAAGSRVAWAVSETACRQSLACTLTEGIPAGHWVRFRGANLRCLIAFSVESLTWKQGSRESQIPLERRYTRAEHNKNWMLFVNDPFAAAGRAGEDIPVGAVIQAAGRMAKSTVAGASLGFMVESAADWHGPWRPVSAWTIANMIAGEPKSLEAYLRADARAYILYVDEFGNPALPGKRRLTVQDQAGKQLMVCDVDNKPVTRITREWISDKTERISVRDDKGFEASSNARLPGLGGERTYFGDLHFHSEFSGDAYRPIRDCLTCAFDVVGLDFAALGDHFSFHRGRSVTEYFDILDEFNKPALQVTLLGYELGLGNGHMNPCYRNREQAERFQQAWKDLWDDPSNVKGRLATLEPFFKRFDPSDMFAIPHHTNHTSGAVVGKDGQPNWRHFDFRTLDVRYVPLVEMCQTRGAFETEDTDADWRVKVGGYGASLRTALARGLRIGFVGGSDNHHGWPTRSSNGPGYCAVTGVQARDLTRDAIFDALKSRRTYATTGARILLDFRLNDRFPMGSEAKLTPTEKHTFAITIKGTAPIERVEIISQGATLAKLDAAGKRDVDLTWTDPRPDAPADDCYYYVRVRQSDGHCAWSSPIWVDCADRS